MTRLTPQLLLNAYSIGIFPMAESRTDPDLYWVDPEERGVLPLDGFHISKRLARTVRSERFEVRADSAFLETLEGCAQPTPERPDTWISEQIKELYLGLAASGHAHSVECWRDGRLVGGLYGVALGGAFFGESMFSRETDASKVALVHLVVRLRLGGFQLLDTQFVTHHLAQFGAREIPRAEYRRQLGLALRVPAIFQIETPLALVLEELDILRRPPYGELTSFPTRFGESIE